MKLRKCRFRLLLAKECDVDKNMFWSKSAIIISLISLPPSWALMRLCCDIKPWYFVPLGWTGWLSYQCGRLQPTCDPLGAFTWKPVFIILKDGVDRISPFSSCHELTLQIFWHLSWSQSSTASSCPASLLLYPVNHYGMPVVSGIIKVIHESGTKPGRWRFFNGSIPVIPWERSVYSLVF